MPDSYDKIDDLIDKYKCTYTYNYNASYIDTYNPNNNFGHGTNNNIFVYQV